MSAEKKPICRTCGGKLSNIELNDNIYAGLTEAEYVCYACQSDEDVSEDDIQAFPFDGDEGNEDF